MNKIESKQNPRVKQWKKLHSKKGREKAGHYLIEGPHLVEEALKSHVEVTEMIVEEDFTVPESWNLDLYLRTYVPKAVMNEISDTETPQGIAAVCRINLERVNIDEEAGQYLLVDSVQDPGNIGTIIRTADSVGLSAVILGEGCADPYNSKVLRSTQGSIFHLPVIQGDLDRWINDLQDNGTPVFGSSLQDAKPYKTVEPPGVFALIVGNEGNGVAPHLLHKTDERLYIPIHGQAESLNVSVAAGILLYYLRN